MFFETEGHPPDKPGSIQALGTALAVTIAENHLPKMAGITFRPLLFFHLEFQLCPYFICHFRFLKRKRKFL